MGKNCDGDSELSKLLTRMMSGGENRGYRLKIFHTGLQRTGTTSLTKALNVIGLKALQFPVPLYKNPRDPLMDAFDAFSDFPIPLLYRQLDTLWPGSRFIHTIRDEEPWLRSVEWLFTTGAVKFEWGKRPVIGEFHRAFYGISHFDADVFLARYRAYNNEVLHYFLNRPQDFMILRIEEGEGFERLCPFLGRPVPQVPFPHDNRREGIVRVMARKLAKKAKRILLR